jgi:hypothetical protein
VKNGIKLALVGGNKDVLLSLPQTWACILVLLVLVTPVLNYFHRHSPYYEYFYRNKVKGGLNSLYNCLWYMYGALMQQGQFRRFWKLFQPEIHVLVNNVSKSQFQYLRKHIESSLQSSVN